MPIRFEWHNEARTILHCRFEAEWCWEELYQAIDDGLKLIEDRFPEIDVILASPDVHAPGGNMLFHARRLLERLPPRHGLIIIVSSLPLLRKVVSIINQVHKTSLMTAPNLAEAYALIAQYRATVDDLAPASRQS